MSLINKKKRYLKMQISIKQILLSSLKYLLIGAGLLCLTACESFKDGMLNPKGLIAYEERKLFFDTLALMLIVVLPVIVMSIAFVFHYRVSHHLRDYKPNWSHNYFLESLWWGIPCVIIVILAILTWKKTYELDPWRQVPGHNEKPLLVQVIALPWKWLFIYPEQNIATINYLVLPVGQSVEYWTTTDNVPMSAFFIPQLGSQIYAMSGMRTKLFLYANETTDVMGMNTLFNGNGFAEMRFPVHVVSNDQMQQWFNQIKSTGTALTMDEYKKLLLSSVNEPPKFYNSVENNLFQNVLNTYMNSFGPNHPRDKEAKFQTLNSIE